MMFQCWINLIHFGKIIKIPFLLGINYALMHYELYSIKPGKSLLYKDPSLHCFNTSLGHIWTNPAVGLNSYITVLT